MATLKICELSLKRGEIVQSFEQFEQFSNLRMVLVGYIPIEFLL